VSIKLKIGRCGVINDRRTDHNTVVVDMRPGCSARRKMMQASVKGRCKYDKLSRMVPVPFMIMTVERCEVAEYLYVPVQPY
jgi:hypothetical protein